MDGDGSQNKLLNTKIHHNNKVINIRLYIDKHRIQCTNCQHLNKQWKATHVCIRCSGSCPQNDCRSGVGRLCANCKGPHASTNKTCPVLKQHIQGLYNNKKSQTYAEAKGKQQQHALKSEETNNQQNQYIPGNTKRNHRRTKRKHYNS